MSATGSRKIDRLVAQAEAAGLVAEVTIYDSASDYTGVVYRSVAVRFQRPRTEPPQTALDRMHNYEHVTCQWSWSRSNGATPRLIQADWRQYTQTTKLTARKIQYVLQGMAD